jgi:CNT family concentrative nucleoside transporter
LIAASVMAAPVGLAVAKILVPEDGTPETAGTVRITVERSTTNVIDAIATGTLDGLKLAVNVGAMLLVFIAMIALVDAILGATLGTSLGQIFGFALAPLAWCMGVPWSECRTFGDLLGTKIAINELVAYVKLSQLPQGELSHHARVIATYALCGFANFASIGIQIGGIGGLAPERRADLAKLGLRAMLGGAIATCITAAVAGVLT